MSDASTPSTKPLAVVTGASSGIGRALAEEFARRGYDLLLTATSEAGLADVANDVRSLGADVAGTVAADLTHSAEVDGLAATIEHLGRPVDAVAINAGFGLGGPFESTPLERELAMVALNVTASVHLAKHVVPAMVARGRGAILFTSSIAAITPTPFEAVYGATKSFVKSFAESLHAELKDKGVRVCALQPGPTQTNFFHKAEMDDTKIGTGAKDDPADVARQGLDALFAGKSHIVAGSLRTKAQGALMENVLPEQTKATLHKSRAAPGTAAK